MADKPLHGDETVVIHVGPSYHPFTVDESMLKEHSTFFNRALREGSRFQEAATRTINLPELDVQAFEAFVRWMTTGEIFEIETEGAQYDVVPGWERREILCNLYVLADYLDNPRLRNETMTALVSLEVETDEYPDVENIAIAYEETLEDSPPQKFVLNSVLANERYIESLYMGEAKKTLPEAFSKALQREKAKITQARWGNGWRKKLAVMIENNGEVVRKDLDDPCSYYHHHDLQVPKCERCTKVIVTSHDKTTGSGDWLDQMIEGAANHRYNYW